MAVGGQHDESSPSSGIHDARLRLRNGPVSGSRDEPRDHLRRREGHALRDAVAPPQSHARAGARGRSHAHRKSVIAVRSRHTPVPKPHRARYTERPMPHARKSGQLPEPHTIIKARRGTLRFYLGDCLDVLASTPAGSISVVVTSPPYNLGVATAATTTRCRASTIWNGPASGFELYTVFWNQTVRSF